MFVGEVSLPSPNSLGKRSVRPSEPVFALLRACASSLQTPYRSWIGQTRISRYNCVDPPWNCSGSDYPERRHARRIDIPADLAEARALLDAARKALLAAPTAELVPIAARLERMAAEVRRIEPAVAGQEVAAE
jgi:hypothetical protein